MAKLKVFSGYGFLKGISGQIRILVATTSQKRASELLGVSVGTLKNYFTTGNKEDIELAVTKPETIFYSERNAKEWVEYIKEKDIESNTLLPFEKELNDIGVYIIRNRENYELQAEDKAVISDITCDSSDELKDEIIKDMKYHIEMIETEDEHYFDDCDAEYLKTEWKDLVEKILSILNKY